MVETKQVADGVAPWGRGQARSPYWAYEPVDTAEGLHYRVFDPMDNYQGSYHHEESAQEAVWEHNREIAMRDGKLLVSFISRQEFIWIGPCLGKMPGLASDLLPGQIIRNRGMEAIWIDQERFDADYRVYRG